MNKEEVLLEMKLGDMIIDLCQEYNMGLWTDSDLQGRASVIVRTIRGKHGNSIQT